MSAGCSSSLGGRWPGKYLESWYALKPLILNISPDAVILTGSLSAIS